MPVSHRPAVVAAVAARLVTIALGVALTTVLTVAVPVVSAAGSASTTVPPTDTTNPFLPDSANLGDCLSSMPRPDCGSAARGGFAQWSVFVVLVVGLAFIGWRVVRGARRNAAAAAATAARRAGAASTEPTP